MIGSCMVFYFIKRPISFLDQKRSWSTATIQSIHCHLHNPPTKPVDFGKVYEVDITEITGKGYTIARVQGFIVFIVNGKIGNRIKIKVTEVVYRFAKATIEA